MSARASTGAKNIHLVDGSLKKITFLFPGDPFFSAHRQNLMWYLELLLLSQCRRRQVWILQGNVSRHELCYWIFYTREQESKREWRECAIPSQIWHQPGPTPSCRSQLLNRCHPASAGDLMTQRSGPAVSMKVPGLIPVWTILCEVCMFSWRDKVSSRAKKVNVSSRFAILTWSSSRLFFCRVSNYPTVSWSKRLVGTSVSFLMCHLG